MRDAIVITSLIYAVLAVFQRIDNLKGSVRDDLFCVVGVVPSTTGALSVAIILC